MLNIKKLIAITGLATVACVTTPVVMADQDDYRIYQQNKAQYITPQAAGKKAQAEVQNSRVLKIEFDMDDQYGATYEVDLITDTRVKYDAKVDAKTGRVIYVQIDD